MNKRYLGAASALAVAVSLGMAGTAAAQVSSATLRGTVTEASSPGLEYTQRYVKNGTLAELDFNALTLALLSASTGTTFFSTLVANSTEAALRVPLGALQRMEGRDVVFVRRGDTYAAAPVTLGVRDGAFVEVKNGLSSGDEVVVEQSFLVKADIAKAGAKHEH